MLGVNPNPLPRQVLAFGLPESAIEELTQYEHDMALERRHGFVKKV